MFYKDTLYRKYCDYLGISSIKRVGEKYDHYLSLIKDIAENIKKETLHKAIDVEHENEMADVEEDKN